jgi:hypothetical protein
MQDAADEARAKGELNIVMANRITAAVAIGERDLDVLKKAALSV